VVARIVIVVVVLFVIFDVIAGTIVIRHYTIPNFTRLTANTELVQAERLIKARDFAGAIAACNRALATDPRNPVAFALRSYAYNDLGLYDKALQDGDSAVTAGPTTAVAHLARGWAHQSRREWNEARDDLDKSISLQASFPAAYEHRALVRAALNDDAGALADLDRCLEISPDVPYVRDLRAALEYKMGDFEAARTDETLAIDLNPKAPAYLARRAKYNITLGDPKAALADAQKAIGLNERYLEAYFQEARAQLRLGDPKSAEALLIHALEINPHYSEAFEERGIARFDQGDFAGAQEDFRQSLSTRGGGSYTQLWLWIVAERLGVKDDANLRLSDALAAQRRAKDGTWNERMEDLLLGRTTPEAAIAAIDPKYKALARDSFVCEAWYFAAQAALGNNDTATAKSDLQKAVATKATGVLSYCEAARQLAGM